MHMLVTCVTNVSSALIYFGKCEKAGSVTEHSFMGSVKEHSFMGSVKEHSFMGSVKDPLFMHLQGINPSND